MSMDKNKIKIERATKWNKEHIERKREIGRLSARRRRALNREEYNRKQRDRNRMLKLKVINHYSKGKNCCACCGETTYEFLSIDHVNENGSEHRKHVKGTYIIQWLINNNFPNGFQILCFNCNSAKGFFGECPHKINIKSITGIN